MKADEILVKLINLGVIHKAGNEYFLTTILNDLEATQELEDNLTIETNEINLSHLYPREIREASSNKKVDAVLDYCKVPLIVQRENTSFMVRSSDNTSKNILLKYLKDSNIIPSVLLTCIKDYYAFMMYPKSFKKFVTEGDLYSLYKYYENGNKLGETEIPDNTIWMNT